MGAGSNGNNQREFEENGNKAWLNVELGMKINYWEWEGMRLKKTFPLISSLHALNDCRELTCRCVKQRVPYHTVR